MTTTNLWWPLAHEAPVDIPVATATGVRTVRRTAYRLPTWAARFSRAVLGLAVLGVALWWLRRRGEAGYEILLALALVLMLRALLDFGTYSYYHAPFLAAIAAYEALVRRRLPWISLAAVAGFEVIDKLGPGLHDRNALYAIYLAWALPLTCAVAFELNSTRATRAPDSHARGGLTRG